MMIDRDDTENVADAPAVQAEVQAAAPTVNGTQSELEMLRTIVLALLEKIALARGKNVTIRIENLFSIIPEVADADMVAKVNAWYANHMKARFADLARQEEARKAVAASAKAKLSPEELEALGIK